VTTLLLAAAVVVATVALVLVWRSGRSVRKELDSIATHLADDRRAPAAGIESVFGYLEQAAEDAHTSANAAEADRDRFFEALRAHDDGVVVVDANGTTVLRNAAAERYHAARHADALAEAAIGELLEQARGGEGGHRELTLFGPPREVLSVRSVPLRDGAGVFGAVAYIRDVSETRRTESVRRDFVANVSHELKTPIGALALLAETMAAGGDPVVMHQLAERVLREADRLARIVDDLLDLSLIEAQEAPTREPTPVATIVAEAVERVKAQADAADIPVLCGEIAPELVVSCDHRQLVSALTNLFDNAVKYSDAGRPIECTAVATQRGAVRQASITVRDHGLGIPSRDLERIFERFYRVDRARSRATGGTGLGLAIVRHVAHAHGGEVTVESREGEGSAFTFTLPLAVPVHRDGRQPTIPSDAMQEAS
jgi:two-component system, OmpR family, sensor histidine kinase SenX3